ncbi:MAG: hypothetical protein GC181_16175, partial [Bacteroidetes bacterium]|nr:hypothetical protein [Bacteroidota bacterium]
PKLIRFAQHDQRFYQRNWDSSLPSEFCALRSFALSPLPFLLPLQLPFPLPFLFPFPYIYPMIRKLILFVLIFVPVLCFVACNQEDPDKEVDFFQATVLYRDGNCDSAVDVRMSEWVPDFSQFGDNDTFLAVNMPQHLKVNNKKVTIKFRKPTEDEGLYCKTLGINYPQIYIEQAY